MRADFALLTDRRYLATDAAGDWYLGNILQDDGLLQAALAELGLSSQRVDWADPRIDWSEFRCAVFRTTWDYFDRFAEFCEWFRRAEQQVPFCNVPSTIWWNLDKHYLADLERNDIPIVPSHFLERGCVVDLAQLLKNQAWDHAVIKPCVSGAARHTYRLDASNAEQLTQTIGPLLREEAFLVQPFQQSITAGEDTLMVFDGRYTHAVRKIPKAGDFRVQDDHGGTVHELTPTAEQIELAQRAMAVCQPLPVYGRVDLVRDNQGRWAVMEMELIEPELWIRFHPKSARAFAKGLSRLLQ
jgi:glutathione synthase/RimK-type ligase-like ATP-grasp enzyme